MRNLIKKFFNLLGLDISFYYKPKKSRKTKDLTFYETITGNYYLPTHAYEDIVANTIKANRIFEKEVVDIAEKYIQPNTLVLDIGSNFGQMSILFSNFVGQKGKVYSFDADDWVYHILNKNIEANNKQGIIIPHFGAVHNMDNETLIFPEQDFEEYGAYGSYGINYNSTNGRKVKSITVDSLNINERISFMKIDIQGGDLQAMQGAVKTIEKNKMPIIFEYEYHLEDEFNMSFQSYVDFVSSINYKFHKVINGHNYLILPQ